VATVYARQTGTNFMYKSHLHTKEHFLFMQFFFYFKVKRSSDPVTGWCGPESGSRYSSTLP